MSPFAAAFQRRATAGGAALGLTPRQVNRQPDLRGALAALQQPTEASACASNLASLLALDLRTARSLLRRHPLLIRIPDAKLCRRARGVAQVFHGVNAAKALAAPYVLRAPTLLTCRLGAVPALLLLLRALAPHLGLQGVQALLRAEPRLLAHPYAAEAGRHCNAVLSCLAEQCGVPPSLVAQQLVARQPRLLLMGSAELREACEALASTWQLPSEALWEVVVVAPELLCGASKGLKVHCQRLHYLIWRSYDWRRMLPRLPSYPQALARALLYNTSRHDRLYYLVRTHRARGLAWHVALRMTDQDWHDMYPGYREWLARHGR